jgi:hypothetical protein
MKKILSNDKLNVQVAKVLFNADSTLDFANTVMVLGKMMWVNEKDFKATYKAEIKQAKKEMVDIATLTEYVELYEDVKFVQLTDGSYEVAYESHAFETKRADYYNTHTITVPAADVVVEGDNILVDPKHFAGRTRPYLCQKAWR